ncbi:aminotransferase class IV family protein [Nonomuraea africana]|uniref:Branched-subunit amino acid aminotransferase/4-amino-4-deoxychorismate lyase n=1 Tax=Nonomuraea africana TaxID=46171 RepID=A0ABR9KGI3_9ACTN|nr:aminotransferase class IV [Nonomuraea africana]MBE1561127.1 branched-subunit amino acid aminotransferase/4-amino-4-deoxychorismate lyase [Nonomuraea africana]
MITVIDGSVAGPDAALPMLARNGHFTAMQVRDRRTRGLELHLARLQAANLELYGEQLDTELVLDSIRTGLGDDIRDASVRVYVLEAERPHVFVTVRPPQEVATTPRSVMSVVHQRFLPHIKHTGGFAQGYFGARAAAAGFDEALFTTAEGLVSEGTITNLGCFDGTTVIWPDAPMLHGIAMQVMERELLAAGIPQDRHPVRVGDLPSFAAVFLTNSHGVVMVGRLEDRPLPLDEAFAARLLGLYANAPQEKL